MLLFSFVVYIIMLNVCFVFQKILLLGKLVGSDNKSLLKEAEMVCVKFYVYWNTAQLFLV